MNSKEDKINIDPDYARNNTALRNIIEKDEGKVKFQLLLFVLIFSCFSQKIT